MWIKHNNEIFSLDNVVKITSELDEYSEHVIASIYFITNAGESITFARRAFPYENNNYTTIRYHAERYIANILELLKALLKPSDIKIEIKEAV